jgi:nucleotide-binding universal stress UspA family protein
MAMFERILLAVDGSPHSAEAVPVAADLAFRYGGELVVFHARELDLVTGEEVESSAEANELVDGLVRDLKDTGISARGEIVSVATGGIARAIVDASRDEHADLVVLATRGLSDWSRLLVGSVSHDVVHRASVPVLVVRGAPQRAEPEVRLGVRP